jgi:hypothetical protein
MPQEVFDLGAVTIAQLNLTTNMPVSAIAQEAAKGYQKSYKNDRFEQDWIKAAELIILMFQDLFKGSSNQVVAEVLRQMQFCIKYFNLNGSRRKRKFLGGTFFNKEKKANPRRIDQCIENLLCYHIKTARGQIILVPPNWHLGSN